MPKYIKRTLIEPRRGRVFLPGVVYIPGSSLRVVQRTSLGLYTELVVPGKKIVWSYYEELDLETSCHEISREKDGDESFEMSTTEFLGLLKKNL